MRWRIIEHTSFYKGMLKCRMRQARAGFYPAPSIYSVLMAAPPDLASLAKRHVDLWQDQLIALAADPDLAAAFARVVGELTPLPVPPGTADWRGRPQTARAAAAPRPSG